MTKEFQVEAWSPRGIGFDSVPHLINGGENSGRPNISGFVNGLEAGKRVAWAITPAINRDAEPSIIRAVRTKSTEHYQKIADRVEELYDAKDALWEEDRKANRPYRV